ncbi:MAG: hypothetical protein LBM75_05645 [Myxococcales bacterium]|nr:hypothetical protein [Myxococcales bacterium]
MIARRVLTLVVFAALSACAHGGPIVERAFPLDFALIQVVEVQPEQGAPMSFLASLRRQGSDFELTLLDPIVQRPLYEAHTKEGRLIETRPLPEEARGLGALLFGALRQLFESDRFEQREAGLRFTGSRFEFEFEPWPDDAACPFPAEIRMWTRGSPKLRAVAKTEDIACGG